MREQGRLTEWNDDRGFGFVSSLAGDSRAFVHISEFPHESRRPVALDLLTYETQRDERGRLQACEVRFLAPVAAAHHGRSIHEPPDSDSFEIPMQIPLATLGAFLLLGLVLRGALAVGLLVGYLTVSGLTYVAYAMDKSAAQRGRFRTQESALHLLELVGGWPGALLAQRRLRHKTRKRTYQFAFWMIVILNLVALFLVLVLRPTSPG
jgi:uncharacterized membrane protein YsdA (DUF1294 family)/cold shock CspA family protein